MRAGFAILFLLAVGCVDAVDLVRLRSGLTKEFHEDAIGVSLTDGLVLTVTFVNDGPAVAPCDSLAALSMRVAAFVRGNYEGFDSLQTVSIAFAHRDADSPGRATASRLPFRFSRAALQSGQLSADSASAVALCALDADPRPATP